MKKHGIKTLRHWKTLAQLIPALYTQSRKMDTSTMVLRESMSGTITCRFAPRMGVHGLGFRAKAKEKIDSYFMFNFDFGKQLLCCLLESVFAVPSVSDKNSACAVGDQGFCYSCTCERDR